MKYPPARTWQTGSWNAHPKAEKSASFNHRKNSITNSIKLELNATSTVYEYEGQLLAAIK